MRKQWKQTAKSRWKSRRSVAAAILFFSCGVTLLFALLEQATCFFFRIPTVEEAAALWYRDGVQNTALIGLGVFLGFAFAKGVLLSPLTVGEKRWYLALVFSQAQPFVGVFAFYGRTRFWWKSVWLSFRLWLRKWTLRMFCLLPAAAAYGVWVLAKRTAAYLPYMLLFTILVIGLLLLGLLMAYLLNLRYFLAPYLIGGDMLLSSGQALRESKQRMKGFVGVLFQLELSFLPLYLTCVFIIPVFFVLPYCKTCRAEFARIRIEADLD